MASRAVEPPPSRDLYTAEEVAHRLHLGRTTVYKLIATRELGSVKVGRLRRIPAACLSAYVRTLQT